MYVIKQIKLNTEKRNFQSLTHNEIEKLIRRKHTIHSSEVFNSYITNHNKKFETHLVKNEFKLVFNREISPHIKTELVNNLKSFHSNRLFFLDSKF